MAQSPYSTNDPAKLRALGAAADVYLQGQLTAAVAADQRALVFAGFLAAAVSAIGAAAATSLTSSASDHFLGRLGLGAAGGLLVAMIFAVAAARPIRWYFPGSHPEDWQDDFASAKPEIESLQELLADYDDRISNNHAAMKSGGRLIMCSAVIAICTLWFSGALLVGHTL